MDTIATYRISDFVLFSQDALFEIYEAYNHDYWPLQMAWLAGSLFLGFCALHPTAARTRILLGILAFCWIWVSYVFHLGYFVPINWAARYFAWLFFVEAIFVLGIALRGATINADRSTTRVLGLTVFALSAFFPWELMAGMTIQQTLPFGWGPFRTASGSAGLFLLLKSRLKWLLFIPPIIYVLLELLIFYGLK